MIGVLRISFFILFIFYGPLISQAQKENLWHGIERTVRYQPEETDITITNGNRRFTRALYGTNTAFRIEFIVLPELAVYVKGISGNNDFERKTESIQLKDRSRSLN